MRRRYKPKTFEPGQPVEVQREPGHEVPWEPATYRRKVTDMKGWHSVEYPEGRGRYIDSMSGMETAVDNPRAYLTLTQLVPTQRIRVPKDLR